MDTVKLNRINNDVKRALIEILKEVKDPRVHGLLTVVRVKVSGDLSYADVFVSAMDGLDAAKEAVQGLKSAQGYIRRELSQRLTIRKTPLLRFIADDSIEYSAKINEMLRGLE